jgi:hypothetical protein
MTRLSGFLQYGQNNGITFHRDNHGAGSSEHNLWMNYSHVTTRCCVPYVSRAPKSKLNLAGVASTRTVALVGTGAGA